MALRISAFPACAVALAITVPQLGQASVMSGARQQHDVLPPSTLAELVTPVAAHETLVSIGELDFTTLNQQATTAISTALKAGAAACGAISEREYVIGCLAVQYAQVAALLPVEGDYAPVKSSITTAAVQMQTLTSTNRSSTKDPVRIGGAGRAPGRVIPVDSDSLTAVGFQASQVVSETQTVLLRSTDASAQRQLQYQQIAEAMDTGALLLRSL